MKLMLFITIICFINGCSRAHVPKENALKKVLATAISVTGTVTLINEQPSKYFIIEVSKNGTKFTSNLNLITQDLVNKAATELKKLGVFKTGTTSKEIALKVTKIFNSEKVYISVNSNSSSTYTSTSILMKNVVYTITLGNGKQVDKIVQHDCGDSLEKDFADCIAESVIELFKDKTVRDYLVE